MGNGRKPIILIEDHKNKRIGFLIILAEGPKKGTRRTFLCKCDCGNEKNILIEHLFRSVPVKSCGCRRPPKLDVINHIGKTYAHLTIIKEAFSPEFSKRKVECKCVCGNLVVVDFSNLLKSKTVSCGCKHHLKILEIKIDNSLTPKTLYKEYISDAKYRGREFKLTFEEFYDLVTRNCYYCNKPPSNFRNPTRKNGIGFFYSGLDRIVNELDYIKNNCVPCCIRCNTAKSSFSLEEFKMWIGKIYARLSMIENVYINAKFTTMYEDAIREEDAKKEIPVVKRNIHVGPRAWQPQLRDFELDIPDEG